MMDIGNLFKNHVSLNGEEMDKRENFLIKSFILVFCLSFSSSIVLSILFNFFIGLFVGVGIFSFFLRLMRYDENLNNKDFEVILSNDIARFIYNLYKFLGIVCIVIFIIFFRFNYQLTNVFIF